MRGQDIWWSMDTIRQGQDERKYGNTRQGLSCKGGRTKGDRGNKLRKVEGRKRVSGKKMKGILPLGLSVYFMF